MDGKVRVAIPKAVLFDWDDTIVSTWKASSQALNTALEAMGMEPWSEEERRRRAGPSAKDLFTELFGERWQEADKIFYDTFNAIVLDKLEVLEGAEATLKALHDRDVYLAVVSNKRGTLLRREAQFTGFEKYFKKIIGAGDAAADKPDIAVIHAALENTGIQPTHDVWFVGDSHTDLQCAHQSGCLPILLETKVPPQSLLDKYPPAHRFSQHSDIMKYINSNSLHGNYDFPCVRK